MKGADRRSNRVDGRTLWGVETGESRTDGPHGGACSASTCQESQGRTDHKSSPTSQYKDVGPGTENIRSRHRDHLFCCKSNAVRAQCLVACFTIKMNSLSAVLHGRLAVLHQGAAEISQGHGPAHPDAGTRCRAVTACPAHSAAADGLEPCAMHMGVIKRIESA